MHFTLTSLAAAAALALRPAVIVSRTTGRSRGAVAQHGELPLPHPWEPHIDQNSGQVYYSNPQTGESQWEPPPAAQTSNDCAWDQHDPGGALWRLVPHAGVTGFSGDGTIERAIVAEHGRAAVELPYSLRAGDSRVLSRWNMVEQALTVSRVQSIVRILPDGTATLVSKGRGPTLWRAGKSTSSNALYPWYPLKEDETIVLGDEDLISLDCNNPEDAVFSCLAESVSLQQGDSSKQGLYEQQGQQQLLPYPWEQLVDDHSGHVFYSNLLTGETQWDSPIGVL
uniref:WW domain-containing protein n=1 Tax=Prymnesium polylepis TaxID=72548 RepID=A0A7S4I4G1_9EUKA